MIVYLEVRNALHEELKKTFCKVRPFEKLRIQDSQLENKITKLS